MAPQKNRKSQGKAPIRYMLYQAGIIPEFNRDYSRMIEINTSSPATFKDLHALGCF